MVNVAPLGKSVMNTTDPRAGMLSTYEKNTLVGIPALPVPMAPGVTMPSLSFYSENTAKGAAKFAASIYDPRTGTFSTVGHNHLSCLACVNSASELIAIW